MYNDGKDIKTKVETLCLFFREDDMSNLKELSNLVEKLDALKKPGRLTNMEITFPQIIWL